MPIEYSNKNKRRIEWVYLVPLLHNDGFKLNLKIVKNDDEIGGVIG